MVNSTNTLGKCEPLPVSIVCLQKPRAAANLWCFGLHPRDGSAGGSALPHTAVTLPWTHLSSFKIIVRLGILCF